MREKMLKYTATVPLVPFNYLRRTIYLIKV